MKNVYTKVIPAREADIVPFPSGLHPDIKQYLQTQGLNGLYSHQTTMFGIAMEGKNAVITTSTASGKTLAFFLPCLQEILNNPSARAVIVVPTKALGSDQYRTLCKYVDYFSPKRLSIGKFDGDTDANERKRILERCNVIITNPDMLHTLLSRHATSSVRFLIANLKYIVLDESHTYKGVFGSNVANIFRRLQRLCKYYGSDPVFLLCSATIANPCEHASKLCCNKQFELIDKDGSPAGEKHYHIIPSGYSTHSIVALSADLVKSGHHFIEFEQTRKGVELLKSRVLPLLPKVNRKAIGTYCASYKPSERRIIENNMNAGKLCGVFSTNALELGIDVSGMGIDTVIINGYPGSVASFFQQSGRGGRRGQIANTFLYLHTLPLDACISADPEFLFRGNSESAVIEANNPFVITAHLRCAAAELPLTLDDIALFPGAEEIIPMLVDAGQLKEVNGQYVWVGDSIPTQDFSIRSIENSRFELLEAKADGLTADDMRKRKWTICEMPLSRANKDLCLGSIYLHNGEMYQITTFNKNRGYAVCKHCNCDYYTQSFTMSELTVDSIESTGSTDTASTGFGGVTVDETTLGFKKLDIHTDENLGFEKLEEPLFRSFSSEGFWIEVPDVILKTIADLGKDRVSAPDFQEIYLNSVGYTIKNAAQIAIMAEPSDLMLGIIKGSEKQNLSLCLYDSFEGGMGYSQKAFELAECIINQAIRTVEGCNCKDGCPICTGHHGIRKDVVLWCLKSLLAEQEPLDDIVIPEPVYEDFFTETERFDFEDIEDTWDEVVDKAKESRIDMADFLDTSVKTVSRTGSALRIEMANEGVANMARLPANKQKLLEMVRQSYKIPENFQLEISGKSEHSISPEKMGRLKKRFS